MTEIFQYILQQISGDISSLYHLINFDLFVNKQFFNIRLYCTLPILRSVLKHYLQKLHNKWLILILNNCLHVLQPALPEWRHVLRATYIGMSYWSPNWGSSILFVNFCSSFLYHSKLLIINLNKNKSGPFKLLKVIDFPYTASDQR